MKKSFVLATILILIFIFSANVLADPADDIVIDSNNLLAEYTAGVTEINSLTAVGTTTDSAIVTVTGEGTVLNILGETFNSEEGHSGIFSKNRSIISAISGGSITAKTLSVTHIDSDSVTNIYASGSNSSISIAGDVDVAGVSARYITKLYATDKGTLSVGGNLVATQHAEVSAEQGGTFLVEGDVSIKQQAQLVSSGADSLFKIEGILSVLSSSGIQVKEMALATGEGRIEVDSLNLEGTPGPTGTYGGEAVATMGGVFIVKGDVTIKDGIYGYDNSWSAASATIGGTFMVEGDLSVSELGQARAQIVTSSPDYDYAYFTVEKEASATTGGKLYAFSGGTFNAGSVYLFASTPTSTPPFPGISLPREGILSSEKNSRVNVGSNIKEIEGELKEKDGNIFIWDDGVLKNKGTNTVQAAGTTSGRLYEGKLVNYGLIQLDFDDDDESQINLSGSYVQKAGSTLEISVLNNTPSVMAVSKDATIEEGSKLIVNIIDGIDISTKYVFLTTVEGVVGADNFTVTYTGNVRGNKYPKVTGSTGSTDGLEAYFEFQDIDISSVDWIFNINAQNDLDNMKIIYDISQGSTGVNGIIELITGLYGYEDGWNYMSNALNSLTGEIHAETLKMKPKNLSEYAFDNLQDNHQGIRFSPMFEIWNTDTDGNAKGYNMVYNSIVTDYSAVFDNGKVGILISNGIGSLKRKVSYNDVATSLGIHAAVYGKLNIGCMALKGYVEYGVQETTVHREKLIIDRVSGYFAKSVSHYRTYQFNASLELVLLDKTQGLIPVFGFEFDRVKRGAFLEHTYYTTNIDLNSDLNINKHVSNYFYLKAGLRYAKTFEKTNLGLTLFYKRDLSNLVPISVNYIGESETFDVYGVDYGKNIIHAAIEVEQAFALDTWGSFRYAGEFRGYSRLHTFSLGLKVIF